MDRKAYNRIKIALLEHQKTGKWLGEQLGKSDVTITDGHLMQVNHQ